METVAVDLERESDVGLMLLMGAANSSSPNDQAVAREALRILHSRYYGFLVRVLEGFAENVGTVVIDPEEFALQTFKKAFEVASKFCDKSDGDPVKASAQVKGWLGTVAKNLARDELSRVSNQAEHIQFVVLDETHDVPEPPSEVEDASPTEPKALAALQESLDMLKGEEREILITYAQFGFPTESGRELPKDVRTALEQRTGYERSTIRQKWRRLSMTLKTQLEPTLKNTKHSSSCQTKFQSIQPTK